MQCGFEVHGASPRDKVMQLAVVHAKSAHNMQTVSPDVPNKASSAITNRAGPPTFFVSPYRAVCDPSSSKASAEGAQA
ncbi:MAG: DUF1059 domain-containing protein [Nitrososphaerota archaeon]|nr:DUF1059 domain-containing protein [Nitrososphaerota archaeon]MDG6945313.1 DUF1059 domain-containing protein [Nitrososphaerota archaeon]MDG6949053.1 DUF1059 domain-containing protein [Nitrososphaerota archaeon]